MRALERLCVAFVLAATPASAVAQDAVEIPAEIMDALHMDIQTMHMELMQASITLQPAQAGPFWATYSEYLEQVRGITTERTELILDFAEAFDTMTDAQALDMGRRALTIDSRRNELIAEYFGRLAAELGGVVAGQFLQIENRIWTLKDLRLELELPIIG